MKLLILAYTVKAWRPRWCLTGGKYNVPNCELSGTELDIFLASVIDPPQVEQETFGKLPVSAFAQPDICVSY
jgi:hypothetical protein